MIDMTSSQINDMFLFHRIIKILTAGRILQISIAWCQIEAEIHSFPSMYGKVGGICGKDWWNQGFRPKIRPKTSFFWTEIWIISLQGGLGPTVLKVTPISICSPKSKKLQNEPVASKLFECRPLTFFFYCRDTLFFFSYFSQLLQCKKT